MKGVRPKNGTDVMPLRQRLLAVVIIASLTALALVAVSMFGADPKWQWIILITGMSRRSSQVHVPLRRAMPAASAQLKRWIAR